MTPAGEVFDYFAGIADLRARPRAVRGRRRDAHRRGLSCASCGSSASSPATAACRSRRRLAAIAAGVPGLARLSAERVWSELKRILAAPDPRASVALMARTRRARRRAAGGFLSAAARSRHCGGCACRSAAAVCRPVRRRRRQRSPLDCGSPAPRRERLLAIRAAPLAAAGDGRRGAAPAAGRHAGRRADRPALARRRRRWPARAAGRDAASGLSARRPRRAGARRGTRARRSGGCCARCANGGWPAAAWPTPPPVAPSWREGFAAERSV